MISIAVSADMLAATRFAVSPLMQAGAVLHPHRPHALSTVSVPRQQVDAVLQERQLPLLSALRREIAYRSGTLHLASEHRIEVSGTTDLTLFPSAVAHSWLISVDPWQERGIYLIYPTRSALGPDRMADGAAPPMGSVLGHSRSTLLAGLDLPRTTPQLADRHHLSPSTVSYHLSHLLRAGLVSRVRERNRVYYRRTAHGERICVREAGDDGASWAGEGSTGRPERKPVVADHEGVVSA
ncbi:winged helix-turn-helix domain-containing protein [Streptomyces tubercidicus]|uniref:winged helix-turn-helix domain-containing protein n=1 Tax=Streptomyces tubercidicus TaxID=47759 RepID=UPI002E18261D